MLAWNNWNKEAYVNFKTTNNSWLSHDHLRQDRKEPKGLTVCRTGSPKAGQTAIALFSLEAIYHCQTHTVASLLPLFKQEYTLHLDISPKTESLLCYQGILQASYPLL